jgi:cell division protein ZapA (FtsZ GTPase activity inhibitor)
MSEVTIQISIAGKNYPLSVKASEEASIRKAEAQLDEAVSLFQKNYGVKDRGDLLAMAALQIITKLNNTPAQVIEKTVEVVVEKEVIVEKEVTIEKIQTAGDLFMYQIKDTSIHDLTHHSSGTCNGAP